MSTYRIILADDHAMFRHGIRRIIEEHHDLEILGEASDGLELLQLLKKAAPDMVVLDISMPNLRGIEATREIKVMHPKVKVLILTMHKDKEHLFHAISAGAEGYLLKEDAHPELFNAIRTIRSGEIYISRLLANHVPKSNGKGDNRQPLTVVCEPLTNREREVLKLIAEGKSNKEIAELLFISIRTVQHHRANMMKKLSFKKTADLIKYAIRKEYTLI
jgi:DNA-binding NarL/FixJ family response regulator